MSCKDAFDIFFNFVALITAAVAFGVGIYQWKRSQEWQKAAKLDDLMKHFESASLLRLAATAIDYTRRTTEFEEKEFHISNTDALLALRNHKDMQKGETFTPDQARLRDAYDSLLDFFKRLEIGLGAGLIDPKHAKAAFGYHLDRFMTFDMHPNESGLLGGVAPETLVARYIKAYGDEKSLLRLKCLFRDEE